jgi:hypothetical protein
MRIADEIRFKGIEQAREEWLAIHPEYEESLVREVERPPFEEHPPRTEILFNGQSTGKLIEGHSLGVAVAWQEFYLLVTDDNCGYFETVTIYLMDRQFNILDKAITDRDCYADDSDAEFSFVALQKPDTVVFRFNLKFYSIRLLPRPRFCLPFLSDNPLTVFRENQYRRHFIVRRRARYL